VSYRTMFRVEHCTVRNGTPACQIARNSSVQNDTLAVSKRNV